MPEALRMSITKLSGWKSLSFWIIAPLILFQDTTRTENDLVPKIVLIAGTLFLVISEKERLTSFRLGHTNLVHQVFYFSFLTYWFLQSIRVLTSSHIGLGSLWWPIQILLIALCCNWSLLMTKEEEKIDINNAKEIMQIALLLYLLFGMFLHHQPANSSIFLSIDFTSRTILLVPSIVLFPLIAISIANDSGASLVRSLISYVASLVLSIQLTDRAVFAALMAMTLFSLPYVVSRRVRNWKQLLGAVASVIFLMLIVLLPKQTQIRFLISDTVKIGQVRNLDGGGSEVRDLDRFVHLEAAVQTVNRDLLHLLFGFGFRQSGKAMAPELEELYLRDLPNLNIEKELGKSDSYITFGLSALLVDFGIIGCLLFFLVCGTVVRRIMSSNSFVNSMMVLSSLMMSIAMLYKVNYLHYPLLFLVLAPNGLLIFLNQLEKNTTST